MNMLSLKWHQYKYYPYERELAIREVERLLEPESIQVGVDEVLVGQSNSPTMTDRLVYFASSDGNGEVSGKPTLQARLERVNGNGPNRQSTRYSAHGLHEYKGKFNPQIAKALLNIFGVKSGDWVLDPFCGSGTSLIEAAHLGINAVGTDINPLAVFLANAKIAALSVPATGLIAQSEKIASNLAKVKRGGGGDDARITYLSSWFDADILCQIEELRREISKIEQGSQNVLLAIASNLLRDYSLQEPGDLRIRRRSSPMPEAPLAQAFLLAVAAFARKLSESQAVLGILVPNTKAQLLDCRQSLALARHSNAKRFDAALTSPPYATALPYIDTQRLSLVWLGLIPASEILSLEAQLIGSREMRGRDKKELLEALNSNPAGLPPKQASFCVELKDALGDSDGFRRQAVPQLLYRYFAGMADSFSSVRAVIKPGGKYGLIVGGNHTVLGGERFDIDTPAHLASLAVSRGWNHVETVKLQTYRRYGLHSKNAGTTEALVVLEA
jgi:site-specific DNA-methyltransferase (cytosine-N4-specific)